jgi:hypothetical protein
MMFEVFVAAKMSKAVLWVLLQYELAFKNSTNLSEEPAASIFGHNP